jgi:solute carrier family 24 (sodium/potassium/calcium exchanger), member 6
VLARNLTIFKFERASWNKWYATAVPFFSNVIFLYALGQRAQGEVLFYLIGGYVPLMIIFFAIGAVFSLVVFATTLRNRPPIYRPLLVFHSFFLSILWIYLVARELFMVLDAFGVILGIPPSILAITVLAWGNSVGDAVSDIVVARKGFPSMAVGAIFGSPLLNLLIGLGIAFTFNPTSLSQFCFPIKGDGNVAITFIFLIIALLSSIIIIPLGKFRAGRIFGAYLILLYVVYIIFAVASTIFRDFGKLFEWNIGKCFFW